jgi:hypothetical protein
MTVAATDDTLYKVLAAFQQRPVVSAIRGLFASCRTKHDPAGNPHPSDILQYMIQLLASPMTSSAY